VGYYTRVLSKDEEFPSIAELAERLRGDHPDYRLTVEDAGLAERDLDEGGFEENDAEETGADESGVEESSPVEWESLLLAGTDGVEVAVLERKPVFDGSAGQDDIADFLEELEGAKPDANVEWLMEYLQEVRTIYSFQHLQGAETVEGSNALHALRTMLWERGDAIQQADLEGFTNEEGYHVVWQFSDTVSGPWNMAVLQDGTWLHFTMDLGDPEHRAAFLSGEAPSDVSAVKSAGRQS
jgi:hypothetical protein